MNTSSSAGRWSLPNWLPPIFLCGIALVFDLYRLGTPSIWFDEAFSVELARQPLPLLWHIIWGPEPNMELYYLFLHFWLSLISLLGLLPTEFIVRFPSAIFAALSSIVVFLLGRRYFGLLVALIGAGLYTLNDLQLVYAQQTRSYSMQLLFLCIGWFALLAALRGKPHRNRWWLCYIAAMTLAIYAHLFSILILLSQLFACGGMLILPGSWRRKVAKQLPAMIGSLLLLGIFIFPMVLVSRHGSKTGWLPIPHLSDIYHLFLTISGDSKMYLYVIVAGCLLALVRALAIYFPRDLRALSSFLFHSGVNEEQFPLVFALICWLVVPVVLSYLISKGSTRLFSSRYLVTIVPPLFLLVGIGVTTFRWRIVQSMLTFTLLLLAVYRVPFYYASAQVEDWNVASHWLEKQYQVGDGIICYSSGQACQLDIEYYLQAYPSSAHIAEDAPGSYSWVRFGPVDTQAGYGAAVDPRTLAAYGAKHLRLFFIAGRLPDSLAVAQARVAEQWLGRHYHFIAQVVTPTVIIRLYETGTFIA